MREVGRKKKKELGSEWTTIRKDVKMAKERCKDGQVIIIIEETKKNLKNRMMDTKFAMGKMGEEMRQA